MRSVPFLASLAVVVLAISAAEASSFDAQQAKERRQSARPCADGDLEACARVCAARGATATCETSCAANEPASCRRLATAFDTHMGYDARGEPDHAWPQDKEKARLLYEQACDLGDAVACYNGGLRLLGTPPDVDGAMALLAAGCAIDPQTFAIARMLPEPYQGYIVMSCNKAGDVQREERRPDLAIASYERACKLSPKDCRLPAPPP